MTDAPPARDLPELLTIATLTKVHGIRGEMKVRCTPEILAFLAAAADEALPLTLRMPETGDEYEVTFGSVRGHESAPIIAIDGVEDRSSAEAYRGALICAPRDVLPAPQEDEYFLGDLEGCTVYDEGVAIGTVRRAEDLPANVVLTVVLGAGGELLVPLVGDAVPLVDVEAGRIEVDGEFLGLRGEDPDDNDEDAGS